MTVFDYVVLFIFATSIVIGMLRGLLKEVISLASWVLAFWVANAYGVDLAKLIPFSQQSIRLISAFAALFIGVRLLMWLLALALESILVVTGLTLIDRALGSLFGAARGCLFTLALMLLCGMTSLPQQPFWRQAVLRPYLETVALSVKAFLPGSYARYVQF